MPLRDPAASPRGGSSSPSGWPFADGARRPRCAARGASAGPARLGVVALALVSFYVTYFAYRNLKSVVPLLRPDELYDRGLGELDRSLFGHDPAALLHAARHRHLRARPFGRLRPVLRVRAVRDRVRARLVPRPRAGLFYVTALSLNWVAGRGQLLPAAVARADLRRPGRLRRPARHRREPPAERCWSSGPSSCRPGRPGRRAEHRRLRLPARRRSSSPPRWRPTCSAPRGRQARGLGLFA